MPESPDGRLVSWKEIAAYLGCDVRTCLRWEKERGLPVHRPGGQPGPRVFAWKHELDQWLAGKPNREAADDTTTVMIASTIERGSISRMWAIISALIIVGGGLAFLGIRYLTMDGEPADFHIDGSRLVIVNKADEELWAFNTGLEELRPESEYRKFFQFRQIDRNEEIPSAPSIVIDDIDGDGRKEVLFVPHPAEKGHSRMLYCFDHRGRKRWPQPFEGGQARSYGKANYSRDYAASFEVLDLGKDGGKVILVFSEQVFEWPTQMALLSPDGRLLGEYWHSGRIHDTLLSDLDADGRKELLIGGVNNGFESAFFAVFDPLRIGGSSPTGKYQRDAALKDGTERAYVLFPWSDIDPGVDVRTHLSLLEVLENGHIRCMIARTHLQFELDPQTLGCLELTISTNFRVIHREKVAKGELHSDYNSEAYRDNLMRGLRYWTGREFVSTPTWVNQRP